MRLIVFAACGGILSATAPLAAQTPPSRFYVAGSVAADAGSRGLIPGGAVPSAGGLVGFRITEAWSIEVEIDRGFRTTSSSDEGLWLSFAPPNSSRDEIERLGIHARFDRTQKAGPGFAATVLWRSREPGAINVGFFSGISARAFDSRVVRTPTFISPELTLPANDPNLRVSDETRNMTGGGYSGGLLIFIQLRPQVTLAPEFRYTHGIITDDPYRVFRAGMRLMWGF